MIADMHVGSVRSLVRGIARRAGKRWLAWRYRNYMPGQQPDHMVNVAGLSIHVARGVFDPRIHHTTEPLVRYLLDGRVDLKGQRLLDLGTGSGVLAIASARAGARRVVAVDISPQAVQCARENAARNGVEDRLEVRQGDMFAAVEGERFDLVVCNPPYFRGEPASVEWQAYFAGRALDWFDRFGEGLHEQLAPGGQVLLTIGDAAEVGAIMKKLEPHGWSWVISHRHRTIVEDVFIIRLTRSMESRT